MILPTALFKLLSTAAGVSSLVSARIYPNALPQGVTYPAVAYAILSDPKDHDLDGATGARRAFVQVSCWADTYTAAKQLAATVSAALDGKNDVIAGSPAETLRLTALHSDERDLYDDTVKRDRTIVDFRVFYRS